MARKPSAAIGANAAQAASDSAAQSPLSMPSSTARPAAPKARDDAVALAHEQAADDHPVRDRDLARRHPLGERHEQRRGQVRDDRRRRGRHLLAEVEALDRDLDAVRRRVGGRRLDRGGLVVAAADRPPAELRRGDREDPRPVPQSASGPGGEAAIGEREQQLEAAARRRMSAGAEGATGIDDDVDLSSPRLASSHEGRTTSRPPPTTTGSWKSRQRSAQSSGISVVSISTRPSPAAARRSGSSGSSPGGP